MYKIKLEFVWSCNKELYPAKSVMSHYSNMFLKKVEGEDNEIYTYRIKKYEVKDE